MTLRMSTRSVRSMVIGSALGLALVAVPVGTWAASSASNPGASTASLATSAQLTEMREEERLAHDVYTRLAETSGAVMFSTIAAAEQRHMDAVEGLMAARGLYPDAAGNTAGDYAVAAFDALYRSWVQQGSVSTDAAYQVGVTVEKRDIADLRALAVSDNDARWVTERLLAGSRHHLAAFTAAADGQTMAPGFCAGGQDRWGGHRGPGAGRMGDGRHGGMVGAGPGWRQSS